MMQSILVIATIALALLYLGREGYKRFFKKDSACDSCAMGTATVSMSEVSSKSD